MAKKDYYETLGVSREATIDEIKQAYRDLAVKYHPDKNPGDNSAEKRFKEVAEAYQVLSNRERRAQYDRFGHGHAGGGGFDFGGGGDPFDIFRSFMEGTGFGDIFGSSFSGGQRQKTGPRSGGDIQIRMKLSLEEIASGGRKKLKLKRYNSCEVCDGDGTKSGSKPIPCSTCNGAGQVRQVSRSLFGQFVNIQACPSCHGQGTVIGDPCHNCHGEGRVRGESEVVFEVPAGVPDQSQLNVQGEGHIGKRKGPRGDLYVVFIEKEHDFFGRDEDDIVYKLDLSIPDAALGVSQSVPTLWGDVEVDIPAGTQTGKKFRLNNKGMPHYRSGRKGDQIIVVSVYIPQQLNAKERKMLSELRESDNFVPPKSSGKKSFWERFKEHFA
jgi:molecular chaperone DnaJ